MPQVKANLVDGFYRNDAKDKDGNPRALTLGPTVNMKPGATRWVPAHLRQESRSVNTAFEAALANGNLAGPMDERDGAPPPAEETPLPEVPTPAEPPTPAEETPLPEVPTPSEEIVPPTEETPISETPTDAPEEPESSGEGDPESDGEKPKKKRRRGRRSSAGE